MSTSETITRTDLTNILNEILPVPFGRTIQCGNIAATTVNKNAYADFSVTFDEPFNETPVVVVSLMSSSTGYGCGSLEVTVSSTTTTGFTGRIFNNDETVASRTPAVRWVAVSTAVRYAPPASAVDYIVEQGTSGDWTYRKWNSGKVEAWGVVSMNVANTTSSSAYGGYRSAELSVSIPSGIFSETPSFVNGTKNKSNSLRLMNVYPSSATELKFFTGSGESVTANGASFSFYVMGK